MRKFISMLLCVGLLCTYTVSAYAFVGGETPNKVSLISDKLDLIELSQEQMAVVTNDLEALERIGLLDYVVSASSEGRSVQPRYKIQMEDIISYVSVNEDLQGNLTFDIHEGETHNVLSKMNDGRLILDGNEVIIDRNENMDGNSLNTYKIEPRARYKQYAEKPFKGKRGNYTEYVKSYYDDHISLGEKLKSVSATALAIIVCDAVSGGLGASITSSIFSSVAGSMRSAAVKNAPDGDSKVISYSVMVYEYVGAGPLEHHYMHQGIYWTRANQKGTATPHEFFEYNYFS